MAYANAAFILTDGNEASFSSKWIDDDGLRNLKLSDKNVRNQMRNDIQLQKKNDTDCEFGSHLIVKWLWSSVLCNS